MSRVSPIPETVTLEVPFRVVKRGGRKEMHLPKGATQSRPTDNALVKALAAIHQARIGAEGADPLPLGSETWQPPRRIVYVSCNPATLARDAGLLVHQAGYRCTAAGVVNMFPHTAHVESMAVFDRADGVLPQGNSLPN